MSVRADTLVAVPGRVSRRRREALTGIGLLLPSVALVLAFTIFPVGYNVWLGFYAKHSLRATSAWVGLGNYTQILTDPDFWRSVWLATVYAVMSTALQIVVGVAGALHPPSALRGLRLPARGRPLPVMIPTVIAVFVWRWLMNDLYGVIPYVLSALRIPGMPGGVADPLHHHWVLIVPHPWDVLSLVLVNVLAVADHPPRALRRGAGRRCLRGAAVRPHHPPPAPQRLLIVLLLRGIWDVHQATCRGSSGSAEARGRRSANAARLHLPALVHYTRRGWARRCRT